MYIYRVNPPHPISLPTRRATFTRTCSALRATAPSFTSARRRRRTSRRREMCSRDSARLRGDPTWAIPDSAFIATPLIQ